MTSQIKLLRRLTSQLDPPPPRHAVAVKCLQAISEHEQLELLDLVSEELLTDAKDATLPPGGPVAAQRHRWTSYD